MALWQWSTTPANNATSAPPINWAEGMPPGLVDDSARQMMADVATWYQGGPEWVNYGNVPTYVNGTQFTVPGNGTAIYTVGRRVRAFVTAGTIYGTVTASVLTSLTTVTVAWDSVALDSGLSEADVGIINPAAPSLGTLPALTLTEPGNGGATLTINAPGDSNGANILLKGNGATNPNKNIRAYLGNLQIVNHAGNAVILSLNDTGDLSVAGNITGNSDERLKKKWKGMARDFIAQLAKVKSGTFDRKDTKKRQVGVGAQSLRVVIPEAVSADENGLLSVAYGQAALVACVELAKEVLRLRALVEQK